MIKLHQIDMGAVEELFAREMAKVVENIHDLNTRADAVRGLTITMKIKPSKEDRGLAVLEIVVTSKLAPHMPHAVTVMSGIDHTGQPDMQEVQLSMPVKTETKPLLKEVL
jgi:hypothetical protein